MPLARGTRHVTGAFSRIVLTESVQQRGMSGLGNAVLSLSPPADVALRRVQSGKQIDSRTTPSGRAFDQRADGKSQH